MFYHLPVAVQHLKLEKCPIFLNKREIMVPFHHACLFQVHHYLFHYFAARYRQMIKATRSHSTSSYVCISLAAATNHLRRSHHVTAELAPFQTLQTCVSSSLYLSISQPRKLLFTRFCYPASRRLNLKTALIEFLSPS